MRNNITVDPSGGGSAKQIANAAQIQAAVNRVGIIDANYSASEAAARLIGQQTRAALDREKAQKAAANQYRQNNRYGSMPPGANSTRLRGACATAETGSIPLLMLLLLLLAGSAASQGCAPKSQDLGVGAARDYVPVKGGAGTPNCYAYAIGLDVPLNPGMISGKSLKPGVVQKFDVNELAEDVIADLEAMGRTGRILEEGSNGYVSENEYRIAVRCGLGRFIEINGVYMRSDNYGYYDYHSWFRIVMELGQRSMALVEIVFLIKNGKTPNDLS